MSGTKYCILWLQTFCQNCVAGSWGRRGKETYLSAIAASQLVDLAVHAPRGSAIPHNIYCTHEL